MGGESSATEWSGGNIIKLGGLPGYASSSATAINDKGQIVGYSVVGADADTYATEWSGGNVINLVGLPGSTESVAAAINDAGQVVGGGDSHAFLYSGKMVD